MVLEPLELLIELFLLALLLLKTFSAGLVLKGQLTRVFLVQTGRSFEKTCNFELFALL